MAVKSGTLENRERDLDIQNREGHTPSAEEQLQALRRKIRAGLNAAGEDPRPKDAPACRECFNRGWFAAMQSLEE